MWNSQISLIQLGKSKSKDIFYNFQDSLNEILLIQEIFNRLA